MFFYWPYLKTGENETLLFFNNDMFEGHGAQKTLKNGAYPHGPNGTDYFPNNTLLASCPWGPVTANGVDLLTVIYVRRGTIDLLVLMIVSKLFCPSPNIHGGAHHHTKIQVCRSIGCGRRGGYTQKEGKLGNI